MMQSPISIKNMPSKEICHNRGELLKEHPAHNLSFYVRSVDKRFTSYAAPNFFSCHRLPSAYAAPDYFLPTAVGYAFQTAGNKPYCGRCHFPTIRVS